MSMKPPEHRIVHLSAGTVGAFGLVSHSYRRAACGARGGRGEGGVPLPGEECLGGISEGLR